MNGLYRFLRYYNDAKAIANGRIGQRIIWRLWGRLSFRIGSALVRSIFK